MKKFIRWLEKRIILWDLRSTPLEELKEMYVLLIMAARRCAYDMAHCASDVDGNSPLQDMWHKRSYMWRGIFEVDSGKKYRHELHYEINRLEDKISRYKKLLAANGIRDEIADADDIPF